jgi:hypothetical protein
MLFLVKENLDMAPVPAIIDIGNSLPESYRHAGPMLACLSIWLVQGDAGSPGGFSAEVRWQDAVGGVEVAGDPPVPSDPPVPLLRKRPCQPISLANPPLNELVPYSTTDFFMIKRLSASSLLQIAMGVVNPGSARVAYSLLLGPAAPTDLIALP